MQSSRVGKFTIWYENAEEFRILKREIFGRNDYYLDLPAGPLRSEASKAVLGKEDPVIVDAGAYIGDTTLYFKQIYPEAKIYALEPFPKSFELLKKNVEENQLTNVELIQAALAPKSGEMTLHVDVSGYDWYTTVSYLEKGWDKRQKTGAIRVRGVTLAEVVTSKIDLLKMDIEGMEVPVLKALVPELARVKNIIAEVHPVGGKLPSEYFRILKSAGYKIEVRVEGKEVTNLEKISELAIVLAMREEK